MLYHADQHKDDYLPEVVSAVKRDTYVDDMLKSLESEEFAVVFTKELIELLDRGSFKIMKLISNSRRVIESVPVERRAKGVVDLDLDVDNLPIERALGSRWNCEEDIFTMIVKIKNHKLTKRGLLSVTSSIYDVLGFLCSLHNSG